ncbi:MAG: DNA polymerase III subunit gamma/tau [Anaerolineales bacterium]|nr:DNA polymerase III subunit gamma/tau [Anaerolineales bacterium]MBS3752515.1 DNA polymerase III subunit gamma/tau [Anaerolineales bacterium]
MSKVLYLKWRPLDWDEVVSQDHVIKTLQNAVRNDRVSHAYLFSGPRGTGKTTTARILAKAVNCLEEEPENRPCNQCQHCRAVNQGEFLDLIEIDAASNTSVEDVRDLRDKINFTPNQGRFKVYIIDEVHMLSQAAFNALLKTLEEPPEHAIFVLATTEVHKIPATVLSRCQRHEFRRIPVEAIVTQLEKLVESEGLEVEPQALRLIAKQATGSLRDAISLLDQLAAAEAEITLDLAHQVLGTATDQAVLELVDALLREEAARGLDVLQAALERGSDPRHFARQVISYLRNVLLVKMGNREEVEIPTDDEARLLKHSQAFTVDQLLRVIRAFNQATIHKSSSWQPSLPLEMAFIDVLSEGEALSSEVTQETSQGKKKQQTRDQVDSGEVSGDSKRKSENTETSKPQSEEGSPSKAVHALRSWDQIIKMARDYNPTTQALLNSCTPLGLKKGCLILSFKNEIIKSKMENGDHLQTCRQIITKVVGEEFPIKCVIGQSKGKDMPQDVDPDGLVATAVRELGGKYVSDEE